MAKAYDELQVTIAQLSGGDGSDPVTGGSCSLDWDLVDADNNDPECYLVGTSYYIRLYQSPSGLDISVSNSNGHINYVTKVYPEVDEEFINFNNSDETEFDIPYYSSFSWDQVGNAYDEDGNKIYSLSLSIASGSKSIKASQKCYAIFKVSYKGVYSKYKFSGSSEGRLFLMATTTCNEEFVVATTEIDILENCGERDLEEEVCLEMQVEVDTESEEGQKVSNQNGKLIRVYGPSSKTQICAGATLGSVTYSGRSEEKLIEEITITKGSGSTSKPIISLLSWEKTGGNFNGLRLVNGQLEVVQSPTATAENCIPYGYGTAKVTYLTQFLKYTVSSARTGKGVFIVTDQTGTTCAEEPTTVDYEIGGDNETPEEGQTQYDIAIVYKDFVTGEPIAGAEVWIDEKSIGSTDETGKIIATAITSEIRHTIKASKPGYLNTDSDSLANDEFIIREK